MTKDASHRNQPAVTILNVDDNEAGRYAKSRILQAAGYRVVEAESGNDALRLAQDVNPQLVLLDVRLPDLDGLAVCRALKDDADLFPPMVVLLVSARAVRKEDRLAGLEHGADGYFVEPFEPDELLATVKALIRLHASEQRIQLALNATREVVWDWDVLNDCQTWNAAGADLFGWHDIVQKPQTGAWWMEKVHPEDKERVSDHFHRVLDDGALTHWQDEYRFLKADHTYAWVSDHGNVLRDESGRALRMVGAMQDVTARKQIERQLLDRNERLTMLARVSQELLRAGSDETALQHILEHFAIALDFELFFHYRVGELPRTLHLAASGGLEPEQRAAFATIRFGQYLCGFVAERQAPLVASDLPHSPYAEAAELCSAGVRCYVGVPLITQDQLLGTMALATRTRDHIREGELELIQTVCDQVAVHLARTQAERRLATELHVMQRLQQLSTRLIPVDALLPLLQEILSAAADLIGTDKGNIQLLDPSTGHLRIVVHQGLGTRLLEHFAEHGWEASCDAAMQQAQRVIVENVANEPSVQGTVGLDIVLEDGIRAIQSTPLITRGGRFVGMLNNHFRSVHRPSESDLRVLDVLARQAADLIERVQAQTQLADSAAQLEAEAHSLLRLNELSSRLWQTTDLREGLREMLAATIELLGADKGNVQLLDDNRGVLTIEAQKGFERDFLDFFREVSATDDSACGRALRSCQRNIVEDVEIDGPFTSLRPIARSAGFRAVQSTPLVGRSGRPIGMLSTHWESPHRPSEQELRRLDLYVRQAADFIERLRIDSALRESEARYRDLVAIMPAAMYACDKDGRITLYNEQAARIWGQTPSLGEEEQKFCGAFKLFCPDGSPLPHDRTPVVDVLRHGKEARNQAVIVERPDGTRSHVLANLSPIRNHQGEIVGAVNVFTDVTEIRQAAERIRLNEERLRVASESAGFGSYDFDPERQVSEWSTNLRTMFNLPQEGPVSLEQAVAFIHPDDRERMREEFEAAIEGRYPEGWEWEFRVVRPNGEVRWFVDSGRPLYEEQDAMRSLVRIVGVVQDMTERKEAEEVLRDSENRFRTLATAAPVGIFRTDAAGNCIYVNEWWMQITDMTLEEAKGMGWTSRLHPEDRDSVVAAWTQASRGHRSFMAEYRFINLSGTVTWVLGHAVPEGERGGYIGTTVDITERKQAEDRLRENEALLAAVLKQSPIGIGVMDRNGHWTLTNPSLDEFVPRAIPSTLADRRPRWRAWDDKGQVIPPEHWPGQRALRGDVVPGLEMLFTDDSGRERWMLVSAAPLHDGEQRLVGGICTVQDIDMLRRAQDAVRRSQEQLALVSNSVPALISYVDTECRYRMCNRAYSDWFHLPYEDIISRPMIDVLGREAWQAIEPHMRSALAGKTVDFETQASYSRGGTRWIHATYTPHLDETKRVLGVVVMVSDITARKHAEAALRESEQRFRILADQSPEPIWVTNVQGLEFVNAAYCSFFGVTLEEVRGPRWQLLIHPQDAEAYVGAYQEALDNHMPFHAQTRVRAADGSWRWIDSRGAPRVSATGEFLGFVGSSPDVTEMKQAQEALRESELRFRALIERIGDVFWISDPPAKTIVYVSGTFADVWGRDPQALHDRFETWIEAIHEDDRARVAQAFAAHIYAGTYDEEYRVLRPDGSIRWVRDRGKPLGVGNLVAGVATDITDRKQAEELIRRSEALARERLDQLTQIYRYAPVGLFTLDRECRFLSINERLAEINGFSVEHHNGRSLYEIVPDLADKLRELVRPVLECGEPVLGLEIHGETPSAPGVERDWLCSYFPLRSADGMVVGLIGAVLEVTARKQAEKALLVAAERADVAQEAAGATLYEFWPSTGAVSRNATLQSILGYRPDEVEPTAAGWKALVHPDDVEAVFGQAERALQQDTGWSMEYRVHHKNGRYVWIFDRARIFRDAEGMVERVVGMVVDISERKRAEVAVQTSEERYRYIFESAGVTLFEEDWSGVLTRLHRLRADGVTDLRDYLDAYPEEVEAAIPLVRMLDVNDAGLHLFKAGSKAELLESLARIFTPDTTKVFKEEMIALWEGRDMQEWAAPLRTLEGDELWVLFSLVLPQTDPEWRRVLVSVTDVTAMRRTEQALRESRGRLDSALDAADVGTWYVNLATGLDTRDAALNRLLGLASAESTGPVEEFFRFVHPDDQARCRATYDIALHDSHLYDVEHRIVRPDGVVRWVRDRGRILCDPDGRPSVALGAMADITGRKEAESALRDAEERLRLAVESADIGTWDLNLATGENRWDHRCKTLFGFAPDEPVPYQRFVSTLHPEDRPGVLAAIDRAVDPARAESYDMEYRIVRTDGAVRWVRAMGRVLFEERAGERRAVRFVGTAVDMTENRQAREQLQRWNVELEQAVNVKTAELLQSQDRLRALATEVNLAEQRERKRLATELHDHLQQMLVVAKMKLAQGKRLAETLPACAKVITDSDNVLSEALTYTRTLVAELSPPVLRDHGLAAGLTWLGEYMNNHGLTVTVTVPEGSSLPLPEDQTVLLFQSVRELLINSSKHAGTDQALVTMNREDGLLRIVVSDQGKGFAAAADSSNTGVSSKFGLYSIRERMRALGGSFDIQSAPGQGTTATLTLSLGAAEPAARARGQGHGASGMQELSAVSDQQSVKLPLAPVPSPLTTRHSPRSPIRVLLVDDHLMVRQGLRMLLEGYRDIELVGEAGDGEEAVALVGRLHPHLVLMDINMPKMNGIEATTRIKSRYPDVAVLGLSVNAGSDTEAAMRRAGAFSLLTKEAAVDQIYASIHEAIKP